MPKRLFALVLATALLALAVGAGVLAQDAETPYTEEEIANSPYLQSFLARQAQMSEAGQFQKDPPYRIALAAQGTSNTWSALFDAHAFWYADVLKEQGLLEELIYADAQANADVQVPQVEDLLAQEPDALILVPMGRAALSAPVERAMAQGVPVILCASGVETDNFVTEVGTNLYNMGRRQALWLVNRLGGEGRIVQMDGLAGVSTAEEAKLGAEAIWAQNPGIEVLNAQYGDWSTAKAKEVMQQWISQYGDQIDGIWSNGAQMSQGIISAYLDAGLPIPPIAGGEYFQGFMRMAAENEVEFNAVQYPAAMVTLCLDTAVKVLQGESVPRFIDFVESMPEARDFTNESMAEFYHPEWSDDVFGPVLVPEEVMQDLGYLREATES